VPPISEDDTPTDKLQSTETAHHLAMLERSEELADIGSWE
jgi:hypothetical protein